MSAPPPPTAPPPPSASETGDGPAEGPAPRRLTRQRHGRLIGGVAVGVARYLGVDPVVVRLGLVVLAFVPFPGFGVLLYVAMLLLVPEQDGESVVATTRLTERTPAFWVGVGLVGAATFALVAVIGGGWFTDVLGIGPQRTSSTLLPLLLIGLGVALWVDADRRPADKSPHQPTPSPPSASPTAAGWQAPAAWSPPVWETATAQVRDRATTAPEAATSGAGRSEPETPAAPAWAPTEPVAPAGGDGPPTVPPVPPAPTGPVWTPPPVPRRPRSPLGRITLGVALLAGGAAWMLDVLEVVSVPVASMFAVVLLVLGIGLVVGSFVGRARWLVAVVGLVLPLTVGAVAVDDLGIDVRGGVNDRTVLVTEAAQLDEPLSIAAGVLTVDLTELSTDEPVALDASVGAGELTVLVPEGVGLDGTLRTELGELWLLGDEHVGVSVRRSIDVPADPGRPTVTLDLRVGVGELAVREPWSVVDRSGSIDPVDPDAATTEVQP